MTARRLTSLTLVTLLAALGCGKSRSVGTASTTVTLPGGAADGSDVTVDASSCTRCHGDAARVQAATDAAGIAFAPPIDVSRSSTGARVGAHQEHLKAGTLRGSGVACASCHVVPSNGGNHSPGVQFRGLASTVWAGAPSISPSYDSTTGTCASTYCHGAFPGGKAASITWTSTAQLTCVTCHGFPPAVLTDGTTAHPANPECGTCHPGYDSGTINPNLHVNGQVDGGCTGCHGDATRVDGTMVGATYDPNQNAAPPVPSTGYTAIVTGAHLAHVNPDDTGVFKPVFCTECHPNNTAGTHPSGTLDVTFVNASAANLDGVIPAETPSSGTTAASCTTYCHDAPSLSGGSVTAWSWDGAAADCGSCHGDPPPFMSNGTTPHSSNTACGGCHLGYTSTSVVRATHIDGIIDVQTSCTSCHGTSSRANGGMAGATYDANQNAAPPVDTNNSSTSVLVGAHGKHVNPTDAGIYKPLLCTECHPDNTTGAHPSGGLQVVFTAATGANLNSFAPSETPSSGATAATCSTYCHNANSLSGGSVTTWSWDGGATTCGSCHGDPPTLMSDGTTAHTANTDCGSCHPGYTSTTVTRATHIDGTIQVSLNCTSCHGTAGRANGTMPTGFNAFDPNQAAAPPVTSGGASTGILVGAHLAHVNPSTATAAYKPIACTECHPDNTTGAHPGGGLQLTFANATAADLAAFTPGGTSSSGTTAATCTTYCHNGMAGTYGGPAAAVSWDGGAATCASCHADPPATAGHVGLNATSNCGACHPGYTATTVDFATHINGKLDGGESVGGTKCGDCHATIFNAMNGTVAKAFKHSLGAVSGTNDSPTDSGIAWAAPLSTANAATARSCVNMCHGDHPHDLTSPVDATHANNAYLDSTNGTTRGGTTRTSATRAKTDFVIGEANGGLCTSCHRNAIVTGGQTVAVATYGASAHDFTAASGFTWQFQLHTGNFDRNCTKCHASNTEGTTPQVTANSSGTNSVHFNVNPSLLAGTTNPAGTAAGFVCYNCHGSTATPAAGTQGDRSGKNIQAQIAKTGSNHPAIADAVHDTTTEQASAGFGTMLAGTARHASCIDCHGPHAATAGTHATPGNLAGPPLQGTWGAALSTNPGFWTAPASTSFTKGAITAGTSLEASLCFKCHSSFYWGTTAQAGRGVPPASPSGATYTTGTAAFTSGSATVTGTGTTWTAAAHVGRVIKNNTNGTWYLITAVASGTSLTISPAANFTAATSAYTIQMAETDTAKEFNPANAGNWYTTGTTTTWSANETAGGFHPVLADAGNNLGRVNMANLVTTNFTWRTTGARNLMTCTDCHESDVATDPNGPHGSAAGFILKGPNTLWNNTMVATSTGMPTGAFCANCHDSTWANSRMPSSDSHTSRSAHRVNCMNCHAAIPHGGPRPGILVAPAGAAAGVGGTMAGWDTNSVYSNPGSGSRLYILSYPSSPTTAWQQNDCGCNGTGH